MVGFVVTAAQKKRIASETFRMGCRNLAAVFGKNKKREKPKKSISARNTVD